MFGEQEVLIPSILLCSLCDSLNSFTCVFAACGLEKSKQNLRPDYMRPARTQPGATSDRSPYKCLFLFKWSRSEKSSYAGFTHSGCWTDTNESYRSEVEPRNHVNTNWISIWFVCDRPGESSSEKNCCWWLTFRQPERKSSSETWLWRWLPLRLSKRQSPTTVLFRTTLTWTITAYELRTDLRPVRDHCFEHAQEWKESKEYHTCWIFRDSMVEDLNEALEALKTWLRRRSVSDCPFSLINEECLRRRDWINFFFFPRFQLYSY